jgi:Uma2 family endonuclease
MKSILLAGLKEIDLEFNDSEEKLTINKVSWDRYEKLLNDLGESSPYRITYLDGILEIMSPSRRHEVDKKNLARLLEIYFEEAEIDFWSFGSTTFRKADKESGKEPDDCYCINSEKELPDLAIEVVITSSGINSLEVYKRLEIKEVWFWHEQLIIYVLNNYKEYEEKTTSSLLPNLDLALLTKYMSESNPRLAMSGFRQELRSRLGNL